MAEKSTIARPYAEAVFSLAQQQGRLAQWSEMLQFAAAVATNDSLQGLVGNPRLGRERLADVLIGVCGEALDDMGRNLIRLLVENGRVDVLPEIAQLYEEYRAEAEKTVQAEIIAAFPVSEAQQARVAAALKARLGNDVTLECRTDETLVGGAIIRAGDLVIDGSVAGKLARLENVLSH